MSKKVKNIILIIFSVVVLSSCYAISPKTKTATVQSKPLTKTTKKLCYHTPKKIVRVKKTPSTLINTKIADKKPAAIVLSEQIEKLAKMLYKQLPKDSARGPIIVTTFVDLNNFYKTCPLGRLLTEELIGDLQRLGLDIIEMRRSNAIFVKQRFGEFALSRDVNQLAKKWQVRYILVGTYFEKGGFLIINARLVSKNGNEIISSASTIINVDPYIASLLTPTTTSNMEPITSIPVKSLDSITNKKNSNVITIKLNPNNKQS